MKKLSILILVVVLCAVGWAGTTYMVGGMVEGRYLGLLERYAQLGPVTLTSQSYQRGFLSSTAQTVLEMSLPTEESSPGQDMSTETLQLVFEHSLRHGPLPLTLIETRLVGYSRGGKDFAEYLAEIPELADSIASVSIGLTGNISSQVLLPAFEREQEGHLISWGGFRFNSEFAAGHKTLVGQFEMPKMDMRMPEGNITWSGISGQFDLVETLPLLYVGTSEMLFGAFDLNLSDKQRGQRNVQLEGFEVSVNSSCDGKLVRYDQTMKLAEIRVDGEAFGPGICEIEAKNLDGESFSDFQGQVQDVYRAADIFSPDEIFARVMPLYAQLFGKLVEGSPELNIRRLFFATPMGDIEGQMLVKFAGQPGLTTDNPLALLQHLEANADFSIAEGLINALVANSLKESLQAARQQGKVAQFSDEEITQLAEQQVDSQLDALLAQNYIVREGENLKASATFNRGDLVLNGQPLPLFQGR